MFKVWGYRKQSEDIKEIEYILTKINGTGCTSCEIYTDADRDRLAYDHMKKDMEVNKGILVISSLEDIGDSKEAVLYELKWYQKKGIELIIASYPSTHTFGDHSANEIALNVLVDVYQSLQDNKTFDIRNATLSKGGRPKVGYPDNWPELYDAWEQGSITATDFMKKSGLKKGTFYHLVMNYKEKIANIKEIKKLG